MPQVKKFTTRAALKKMIRDFNRKGTFYMRNQTIASRLGMAEKTVKNTICSMKNKGEVTIVWENGTRFIKLNTTKKIYPGVRTKSITKPGTNVGTSTNTSVPQSFDENYNTNKSINMILVNDLSKVLTDFTGSLEKYVCSVGDDNLLRITLTWFNSNNNIKIQSPSKIFKWRLNEFRMIDEEKEQSRIMEQELHKEKYLEIENQHNEFTEYFSNLDLEDRKLFTKLTGIHDVVTNDFELKQLTNFNNKQILMRDVKEVYSNFFNIKLLKIKSDLLNKWYHDLAADEESVFRNVLLTETGERDLISASSNKIFTEEEFRLLEHIVEIDMLNDKCCYKEEFKLKADKKVKYKIEKDKIKEARAGELDKVLSVVSNKKIELKYLQSIYKDEQIALKYFNNLPLVFRKYCINSINEQTGNMKLIKYHEDYTISKILNQRYFILLITIFQKITKKINLEITSG